MLGGEATERRVRLEGLGERLAALRLCEAEALARMQQSLASVGQVSAISVFTPEGAGFEVLDGFKRTRAARALGWTDLRAQVLAVDVVGAKVALTLLHERGGLTELEEAWLVRSLYREDHLSQPEIARHLSRHKSWVSRRLLVAEGLDDAVQADVRQDRSNPFSRSILPPATH
jgi:ParB-like chromosome segregation protein Spo0J